MTDINLDGLADAALAGLRARLRTAESELVVARQVVDAARALADFVHPVSSQEHDEAERFYAALRDFDRHKVNAAIRYVATADEETP